MNLHNAVLGLGNWNDSSSFNHGEVWIHQERPIHMLLIDIMHIYADKIDTTHEKQLNVEVDEVLVLSRHFSKSGLPSLTLHPIGCPGESPVGEPGFAGGEKGLTVPPSPRFASLFSSLLESAKSSNLDEEFDITVETTHHGPILSRPTLYLEIGSTENEWIREDASHLWAEVISNSLGMSGSKSYVDWPGYGDVMIGIGGGHYAPRHTSVMKDADFWVGHLIANYALEFELQEENDFPSGQWRHSIQEAIRTTRIAFPGGSIFCHLDRKSFKGWQRNAIIDFLSTLDVEVRRGKDMFS
tara:strand:- start:5095 stop:5988 length:894 start_codon:yes stop_codon:yes gene_type:complete